MVNPGEASRLHLTICLFFVGSTVKRAVDCHVRLHVGLGKYQGTLCCWCRHVSAGAGAIGGQIHNCDVLKHAECSGLNIQHLQVSLERIPV